jgi:hypothetical protein
VEIESGGEGGGDDEDDSYGDFTGWAQSSGRHSPYANMTPIRARTQRLRNSGYEDDSDNTDGEDFDLDDDNVDSTVAYALQLAMKDKEEQLVEQALERIRRARVLGKRNVRLTQAELAALERKRRKTDRPANRSVAKKSSSKIKLNEKRKSLEGPGEGNRRNSRASSHERLNQSLSQSMRAPSARSLRPQKPEITSTIPPQTHLPARRSSSREVRSLPDDPQWIPWQDPPLSGAAPYLPEQSPYYFPYPASSMDVGYVALSRGYVPADPNYQIWPRARRESIRRNPVPVESPRRQRAVPEPSAERSGSEEEGEGEEDDSHDSDDDDDSSTNNDQEVPRHGVRVSPVAHSSYINGRHPRAKPIADPHSRNHR